MSPAEVAAVAVTVCVFTCAVTLAVVDRRAEQADDRRAYGNRGHVAIRPTSSAADRPSPRPPVADGARLIGADGKCAQQHPGPCTYVAARPLVCLQPPGPAYHDEPDAAGRITPVTDDGPNGARLYRAPGPHARRGGIRFGDRLPTTPTTPKGPRP